MTDRRTSQAFTLVAHIQPRARTTEVVGWHGDAIKIRLKAPPVEGAANNELVRFLACQLGLPGDAISIAAGASARRKHLRVLGLRRSDAMALLGLEESARPQ